jgi:hypothetical protein
MRLVRTLRLYTLSQPPITHRSTLLSVRLLSTSPKMAVTLDPPFVDRASSTRPTKTIAVLGAAYGGARAAKLISDSLPEGWKLVVVERNSHFNREYSGGAP